MEKFPKNSYLIICAAVLFFPVVGMTVSGSQREWFILFYEQLCSGAIISTLAVTLFRHRSKVAHAPLLLLLSICCMALGDLCTSITEITGIGQRSIPVSIGLPSYLLFAVLTGAAVQNRYWPKITRRSALIFAISLSVLAGMQFSYVLSPLRHASELFSWVKTSYVLYRLFECANIVLLVPIVVRVSDYVEQVFLQGLLLVHMAGFAISYHNAHGSGQPHAWPAWPVALGTMAVALILDCRRRQSMFFCCPSLCSPRSIRAGVGFMALAVNTLLLLFLIGADVFTVTSGVSLTNSLLAVFACVCLTSVVAQLISQKIESLAKEMAIRQVENGELWEPIEGNAPLSEINNLVTGYNRLVATSNAATEAFAEKSHMLATGGAVYQTAHDIRSPLAALRVVEREAPNLPDDCRELMQNAIGRINGMVEDLLDGYRSGTQPLNNTDKTKQKLFNLVRAVWAEKNACFADRQVKLQLDCEADASSIYAFLRADIFQRSLANLIQNAYEACAEDGKVIIRLIKASSESILEIVDDGHGIAPENLARIVAPGGTIGKANGCGMGLSSAVQYFEECGGQLSIFDVLPQS